MERIRVRAPELRGRRWLNTGGRELSLTQLRGKIVLLDFWTFCCVNCLHVLDELRELEERYADVLVTVGVHSPKFVHEADPAAVDGRRRALRRAPPCARRPRADDLGRLRRPGLADARRDRPARATSSHRCRARGTRTGWRCWSRSSSRSTRTSCAAATGPYVAPPEPATALRFPARSSRCRAGTFLVSDTAHHQLVELEPDLVTERRRIGTGERGLVDGAEPPGSPSRRASLLPPGGGPA